MFVQISTFVVLVFITLMQSTSKKNAELRDNILPQIYYYYSPRSPVTIVFDIDQMRVISLISLMRQNPFRDHISETELVRHIVTINVR